MTRRSAGRRRRLAEGIWADDCGISVMLCVQKQPEETRFAIGTPLDELKAWRLRRRADLLEIAPAAPLMPTKGTLVGDAPAFLALVPAGPKRRDYGILIGHWLKTAIADKFRDEITRQDVKAQLLRWLEDGCAASTVNHRLRALRMLYRELDGEDADNPTDKIKKFAGPEIEARAIPIDLVRFILAQLPDRGQGLAGQPRGAVSLTKIRLTVMAWTGLPHMQLERLRSRDVDFTLGKIFVRPRRKGKGVKGTWLDLIPPAVEALRAYAAAGLWEQPFGRSSMRQTWLRAIARAGKVAAASGDMTTIELLRTCVPAHCRPYDLRHSFLTEAYRVTGDLNAAAELAQHADIRMTKRYTEGAVSERVSAAIAKMSQRWQTTPPPAAPAKPAPVRARHLKLVKQRATS